MTPRTVSNTEAILEFSRPTPVFITNFTGVRSMESIRSLVNAASAHKVFAGSDPFCTYSTVLEDLYHCFFESVLCFLLLGVGGAGGEVPVQLET